jgi:phosphoglycerate-specific signal transduction histidine kinase
MVADIAHELRTPLSLVQGSLEAMLDGLYELNQENLASVHEETQVLTRLVKDLRDLAQVEAGQLHLEREALTVDDLINRAVELFQAEAMEEGVILTTEIAANLPSLSGDRQRLNQVLVNLLSNALRHTPAGGKIVISVRLMTSQGTDASPALLITITDTVLPKIYPTFSSGFTVPINLGPGVAAVRAWAWLLPGSLSKPTAAGFGWRARLVEGRSSPLAYPYQQNPETTYNSRATISVMAAASFDTLRYSGCGCHNGCMANQP